MLLKKENPKDGSCIINRTNSLFMRFLDDVSVYNLPETQSKKS